MSLKSKSITEQSVKDTPKTSILSQQPSPNCALRNLAGFTAQFFQVFVYENLDVSHVLSKSLDEARCEIQT